MDGVIKGTEEINGLAFSETRPGSVTPGYAIV
jgi:hypothetical protein